MSEQYVREFYSREVMTPEAIQELIEIFESETDNSFADLFGDFKLEQEFIKFIKKEYPQLQEYDDRIFCKETPMISILNVLIILEDWAYDILLDGNIGLSYDFSISSLSKFIHENDMAFEEFSEFFTWEREMGVGSWFDFPFEIKDKFDLYLKNNGER